jgi:hypothetical protein
MSAAPPSGVCLLAVVRFRKGDRPMGEWPLWWSGPPDLTTVDLVARAALEARRAGWEMEVSTDCERLVGLLELAGLSDAVGVKVHRQPEGLEEADLDEVDVGGDTGP